MKRNGVVKFKSATIKNMALLPQTIQKEIRDFIRATHVAEDAETYQKMLHPLCKTDQRKSVENDAKKWKKK